MNYNQILEKIKTSIHRQRAKNERRNAKTHNSLAESNYWKKNEHKTDYNVKLTKFLKDDKT